MPTYALATDWDLSAAGPASLAHVQAACISFAVKDGLAVSLYEPLFASVVADSDNH